MKLKIIFYILAIAALGVFSKANAEVVSSTPVISNGVDLELTKSVEIIYPATTTPQNLPATGSVDPITNEVITGWAADPDNLSQTLEVRYYIDSAQNQESYNGKTIASLKRADVNQNTNYQGDHGFEFTIPQSYLDGKRHAIYVYAQDLPSGVFIELVNSGQQFSFGENPEPVEQINKLDNEPTPFSVIQKIPQEIFSTPTAAKSAAAINTTLIIPLTIFLTDPLGLAGNFLSLEALSNFWLIFQRFIYSLLTLLGLRKKRKVWGTVYDSQTKQPLDPAIVTLYNALNREKIEESITDLAGRFGFLGGPGKFYLTAEKTHYRFPSQNVTGANDGIYEQLYHGEIFEISPQSDVWSPNIPMDPLAFDWNQQDKQKLIKVHPKIEYFISQIISLIFWLAVVFTILGFLASPGIFTSVFLGLCLLMCAYRLYSKKIRLWGTLNSALTKKPMAGYTLQLSHPNLPSVAISKALVAIDGKFFLKAFPGNYDLTVYDTGHNLAAKIPAHVKAIGLLNDDFMV